VPGALPDFGKKKTIYMEKMRKAKMKSSKMKKVH